MNHEKDRLLEGLYLCAGAGGSGDGPGRHGHGGLQVQEVGSFVGAPNLGSRTLAKEKEAHGIPKSALLVATEDVIEKRAMDFETFLKYSEVVSDDEAEDGVEG
jgi:hypothetical protein